jgi:Ca2+-binding RTX toxin-like protein
MAAWAQIFSTAATASIRLIISMPTTEGVNILLASGTASGGDAMGDTLISIENVIGSDYDDVIEGDAGANRIEGGRGDDLLTGGGGDDIIIGGRGADTLVGGDGEDVADYTLSLEGVTIDLADALAGGGDALGDSFSGIEIVQGSYHDDIMRGDAGDNRLRGGLGADIIDGRGGFDIADYARSDDAVTVDLSLGQGLAGEAQGDTLISIEMLLGSVFADTFIGSSGSDTFDAGYGQDIFKRRLRLG